MTELRRGENMARAKNAKEQKKQTIIVEVPVGSDLPERLEDLSKYTGLSYSNLLQKWIVQEETLVSMFQRREEELLKRFETRQSVSRPEKPAADVDNTSRTEESDESYRQKVIQRIEELKAQGMTFSEIAKLFNTEGFSTVSGTGKWYPSSVSLILGTRTA
jgi:YesN/AraC family two-component response regulator